MELIDVFFTISQRGAKVVVSMKAVNNEEAASCCG
jgi:hypothetical protein